MKALVVHTLQGQWSRRVSGDRGALDITVTGALNIVRSSGCVTQEVCACRVWGFKGF